MQTGQRSIVSVDERDSSWENDSPRFCVYVQTVPSAHESANTATYDLTGYDFLEARDWAHAQVADGEQFAIALVVDDHERDASGPGTGRGLVWLLGHDLNSS